MGTQNDTIELNGYKYDARTGAQLGRADSQGSQSSGNNRSVDGFVRRPANPTAVTPKQPTPSQNVHSKVIKSKTLRRQGLKKPVLAPKQAEPSPAEKAIASRHLQPDHARIARAAQAQKHPHIAKFQAKTSAQPIEIKPAPKLADTRAASEPTQVQRTMLPLSPFDMALQNANGHERPAPSKLTFKERASKKLKISPRAFSASLGVLLVLGIGGFLANQHLSTLAVQLAATRSGVEAKLPSYEPAGFSLSGPVEYSAGQISLSYQSNSDERNFKIVQKNSDWNSQALLENFVQTSDKQFQTVQDKGKTIYIYEGNNATWVSGGVWFQVEGESSLNTDQLLRIAAGL